MEAEELSKAGDTESERLMDVYERLEELDASTAEVKAARILHGLGKLHFKNTTTALCHALQYVNNVMLVVNCSAYSVCTLAVNPFILLHYTP